MRGEQREAKGGECFVHLYFSPGLGGDGGLGSRGNWAGRSHVWRELGEEVHDARIMCHESKLVGKVYTSAQS